MKFSGKITIPLLHLVIWLVLLAVPALLFQGNDTHFMGLPHAYFISSSIFHIAVFYLNAYFLYPVLLTRKRWLLYLPALVLVSWLAYRLKVFFLSLDTDFQLNDINGKIILLGIVPFLLGSILFRLIRDRIISERKEKEAKSERLSAELKWLRSQVSPHFLFNMMANMVSLARQKSAILEPSLIRLSELLRYMLYESNDKEISLEKEIEHLENYIALQQLRFGEDVAIRLTAENNCPDCGIEPMLLIPFVENAFKHGAASIHQPTISIGLHASGQTLTFSVENNYDPQNHSKDKNSGIGLANVRNRLELLYPGRHQLNITNEQNVFRVDLKIDLS